MKSQPRLLTILDVFTVVLLLIATYMVFFYAPQEAVMGDVQRVFYFHVASGWVGMLGLIGAAVAGIIYLIKKERKWDIVGLGAVEIGIVFIFINIVSGSIWARPIWNTWWTWEPRLTTATIMLLLYLAYLMLRQGIEDPDRRARIGAVYAILASLSVPLTYFSARIVRSIHPIVIGGGDPTVDGSFDMTPLMLRTFMFGLLTFTFIFIDLFWHRIRLGRKADQVEQLRMKTMQ